MPPTAVKFACPPSTSWSDCAEPAVGAATDAANRRSSRLLEKLGMHLGRRADHNGLDTLFYVCTIDDWASGVEA